MTEVVFLLLIGIVLIGLNVNAIKKEKKSFSGTLKDKENNMQDYEIEIGKLRRDLSETVLELQKEIEALKATRESNNLKEVRYNDDLENKDFSKNLYGRNSHNDDKMVNRHLKPKNVEEHQEENFEKEFESAQSDKLNEKDKNEIEYKSVKDTETVNASNIEEQNAENYNNKTNNGLNIYDIVDENKKSNENNVKVTEIRAMLHNGLSVDEIAEKIGIGKGEVLLIKELYIK